MFRQRICALCGKRIGRFLEMDTSYSAEAKKLGYQTKGKPETLNRNEYSCPECYGVDRDRLYALFFRKLISDRGGTLFNKTNLLNIAPSAPLQKYIDTYLGEIQCETMDLFMSGVDYQEDIQNMVQIKDEAYDIWICSHVLEHVQNDKKALKELFRILTPSGIGLLLVPIDLGQKEIDEAYGLLEEENIVRFGQKDHVRKYSKHGFLERVREAGFYVSELNRKYFTNKGFKENAINKEAVLYCCTKQPYKDPIREFIENACMVKAEAENFFRQYPINCEINYYFDKVTITDGYLYVWGWFYFAGEQGIKTKVKILVENSNKDIKIVAITLSHREDIDTSFNIEKNGKYTTSGIEAEMRDSFLDSGCKIFLLAKNGEKTATIEVKQQ